MKHWGTMTNRPYLCTAPWTHTYVSPQGERRLCCASREEATFQKQYLDSGTSEGKFEPQSLEEHWNSDYMKDIRKRMLSGEKLKQCQVCNDQVLNLHTYRQYFTETLFPHKIEDIIATTREDGHYDKMPVSYDYRISNLCNFKCRMCGEQLSSSWEAEKKKHNLINVKEDPWMEPTTRKKISNFQEEVLEEELQKAVDRTEKFDRVEKTTKLCFGDSHSFSMYQAGYMTSRNDGLTLFSILRDGVKEKILEKSGINTDELTHLTFYAGNIDIRHHLCRREDMEKATKVMVIYLADQLSKLNIPNIEISHAIPIENESRKLPKTGYYKDTPFYGSWQERTELVKIFNETVDSVCEQYGWKALSWPENILNDKKELSFDAMEKPQSVHLSREFYRWDMENNCENNYHKSVVFSF